MEQDDGKLREALEKNREHHKPKKAEEMLHPKTFYHEV